LTRGEITENRRSSFPSFEVTHELPASAGCAIGFATCDADDAGSTGASQPETSIVSSNRFEATFAFRMVRLIEQSHFG
jgi:hypothetical protein